MADKQMKCKGQCTACALTCYARRKDYDPSWIDLERNDVANRRHKSKEIT